MRNGKIIEYGEERYYLNDKLHREDGPAVIYHGTKYWYKHGLRHREDGPATEWYDGKKDWYYNGKKFLSEEDFMNFIKFKAFL